ncbi:MAG: hypothetical protein O3A63_11260 [Proteobacteria bacterium]|nr:hypothetical protein [Pseudomonadota bacterium]
MEHIVSKDSVEKSKTRQPWFVVIHCDGCGYVYGAIAKHTFAQAVTAKFVLPKG